MKDELRKASSEVQDESNKITSCSKNTSTISALSQISLFIDENKRGMTNVLYALGLAGLIKIGDSTFYNKKPKRD